MTTIDIKSPPSVPNGRAWSAARIERPKADQPVSIYEVHLDSWRRVPEEQNRPLTGAEIAPKLAAYARRMNFTHVGLLSSASSAPPDTKNLVNYLCEHELGVILEAQGASDAENVWDNAWARQTLDYLGRDPLYRQFHHRQLLLRNDSIPSEHLVLPLSHDLVTQDKQSLIARMPGDNWQKFANMRLLFAYMFALPGKKLVFMGSEFGQWNPWNPTTSLDWHLVSDDNPHGQLQHWVADLNRRYRDEPALHQTDANDECFAWIDALDAERSVISFQRWNAAGTELILAIFNFTPVPRQNYRVGVPAAGFWVEMLNSDALEYGGSGQGNLGGVEAAPFGWQHQSHSLTVTLPPLGAVFFKLHKN